MTHGQEFVLNYVGLFALVIIELKNENRSIFIHLSTTRKALLL